MPKFIKVTEANEGGSTVFLNTNFIGAIQVGRSRKDTHIQMVYSLPDKFDNNRMRSEYYFVKETPEEIEGMLT